MLLRCRVLNLKSRTISLMAKSGDTVADRYTLTEVIAAVSTHVVHWRGYDDAGAVYRITIYSDLENDARDHLRYRIAELHHLVHPAMIPIVDTDEIESDLFVVSPEVRCDALTEMTWAVVITLMDVVEYAHRLGFTHGDLSPTTLCIGLNNEVRLFNFGLPVFENRWAATTNLSTEDRTLVNLIRNDRFAVACAVHEVMSGEEWHGRLADDVSTTPLGRAVTALISSNGQNPSIAELSSLVEGHEQNTTQLVPEVRNHSLPQAQLTSKDAELNRGSRSIPLSWAVTGLAVMAVLAGMFAFIAPETDSAGELPIVRPTLAQPVFVAEPTEPALTPLEQAKQERYQTEGRALADEILRISVQLEDMGVSLWAPESWDQAKLSSDEADVAFRNSLYEEAMTGYKATRDILKAKFEQRTEVLEQFLDTGQEALISGNHERAIRDLSVVNAINPDHPKIDTLLDRAQNLEETITLTHQGRALMSAQDYTAAKEVLAKAVDLDPEWVPAFEAQQELSEALTVIAFNDVMSSGFAALAENNYTLARTKFEEAALIQPLSDAPTEALAQVASQNQSSRVRFLLKQGTDHTGAERWQEALTAYSAALDLDATIVSAVNGVSLAEKRILLDREMTSFITNPIRLTSDEGLSEARRLLQSATRAKPIGSRLREQTDQLASYISLARIPVDVKIESDRETDITIYKVSNLGKITSESMRLAPGSYTVVGKRRGYRDARQELTLLGGQSPTTLYIACTEKI